MIGIYINFYNQSDFESVESELEELGGFEVGSSPSDQLCILLCEYSVDGEECDFTEEECVEIRKEAEEILVKNSIRYSITVSAS